ncbi:MAG TPA: hypothetical protein VGR28_04525, partial [Candidatus Thermoplasmatota archaeon]|nr:hypothetical protein [Candidatus Thermoplasmatota archaeon]
MQTKLLKAGVATAAAMMALAMMPVGVADIGNDAYNIVYQEVMRASGGDLNAPLGTKTLLHPDGTSTVTAITGNEFLELQRYLGAHVDPGNGMQGAPPETLGAGIPYPLSLATGYPFCDTVSIFVESFTGPAGASIVSSTGAALPVHLDCPPGGVGGAGGLWQVKFHPANAPDAFFSCGVAMFMQGGVNIPAGFAGGYACNNWADGCITIVGDLAIFNFGFIFL